MKFFVGIVPNLAIAHQITEIQNRYGNNRLEPHITLRAPVIPLNGEAWIQAVEQVAHQFSPFEIELTPTGNFGNKTLYLGVRSDDLTRLYNTLIPQLKLYEPSEPQDREKDYHAHLTLGRAWCGFTPKHFSAMRKLADEYVTSQRVSFIANFIRIYYKPDNQKGFQTHKDIQFN
jgi:2'-5' RNA ligase